MTETSNSSRRLKKTIKSIPLAKEAYQKCANLPLRIKKLTDKQIETINKSIQLCSVPKSGTNYFRLIFANYIEIITKGLSSGTITYNELILKYPHIGNNFIANPDEDSLDPQLEEYGYSSFMYQHSCFKPERLKIKSKFAKKYIALARNPLDQCVSLYHYHGDKYYKTGFESAAPELIEKYIQRYRDISNLPASKTVFISYERLYRAPEVTFMHVLDHLKIPIRENAIQEAVERSSKKRVKATEEENGKPIHGSPLMPKDQSFVRDGSIGQWQKYFNDETLNQAEELLKKNNISLYSFEIY